MLRYSISVSNQVMEISRRTIKKSCFVTQNKLHGSKRLHCLPQRTHLQPKLLVKRFFQIMLFLISFGSLFFHLDRCVFVICFCHGGFSWIYIQSDGIQSAITLSYARITRCTLDRSFALWLATITVTGSKINLVQLPLT